MSTVSLIEALVLELVEDGVRKLVDVLVVFATDRPSPESWSVAQKMLYDQLLKRKIRAGRNP